MSVCELYPITLKLTDLQSQGHEDKGKRYIDILDAARVKGSWTEIPELIRKVNKHAGKQTTLIHTARAEHYVATQSLSPSTASPATSPSPIETLRQNLGSAEDTSAEEIFQARTCLIWADGTGADPSSISPIQTGNVVPLFDQFGHKGTSPWTRICLVKAVLIQGRQHARRKEDQQAHFIFKAAAGWIELNAEPVKSVPQLAYWSEQALSAFIVTKPESASPAERLRALRIWSTLTLKTQEESPSRYGNTRSHISRHAVWQIYYRIISSELANPQQPSSTSRSSQASELRAVESAYEAAFLRNRKFPKATESNAPVEEWVEQVIQNWWILCGPEWHESDLGEGGRNAVTRNVLDILYRAATKTFHSTLILRRLFQVHKSLTEFDLAYRCLDTFIELTDRSRARSAKSGEIDPGQDSDETILLVVAEGVEGLCAYGGQKEAQKAFDLAMKLEEWLGQMVPEEPDDDMPNGHTDGQQNGLTIRDPPSSDALQIVCRAIGIAKAHWSRWTPFNEARPELQSEALIALQKATNLSQPQLPTLYALAVLCAETRDIPQAIHCTKIALQRIAHSGSTVAAREECAFWHLMTLLLTSQQDFETALQSSAAALDDVLGLNPGSRNGSTTGSIEKLPEKLVNYSADDLDCDDLQRIIELQISYLAIVELLDGPEAALNHSNELLSLYSTLFKRFEIGANKAQAEQSLAPPKSSAGTVKSIRGSVFSRRKHTPPSIATTASSAVPSQASKTARPVIQANQPPAIQVTDETGKSPAKKHGHHIIHHSRASKKEQPIAAKSRRSDAEISSNDGEALGRAGPVYLQHDSHSEAKQSLDEVPHNIESHEKAPAPLGHSTQPPTQDVRLPNVSPESTRTCPTPRFPKVQAQKHALTILNKTWLTVATLYRRSHMFEDAREACEEAAKAASKIEALVSAADTSARVLAEAGWGGGNKSSDEIWADVCCTKAELLHAIAKRREEEGQEITSDNIREIVEQYEQCLMYFPNHSNGIVGLCNTLLDYYEKKVDLAKKVDEGRSYSNRQARNSSVIEEDILAAVTPNLEYSQSPFSPSASSGEDLRKTPENLNRTAARDRAYGLLSTLTKLGTGWDNSEAWFALSRAHELGGEIDKAKNILWWCIELEDTRPIRHWRNLGCGGYVL